MSNRGCSDGGCPFRKRGGMHTNGGCKCFGDGSRMTPHERAQLRQWVGEMRDELEALQEVAGEAKLYHGCTGTRMNPCALCDALTALDKQGGND